MELLIYLIKIIQKLGRKAEYLCVSMGQMLKISLVSLSEALTPPFYAEPFLKQLISVGFNSLPVVGVTALFTGAALALQIFSGGSLKKSPSLSTPGGLVSAAGQRKTLPQDRRTF